MGVRGGGDGKEGRRRTLAKTWSAAWGHARCPGGQREQLRHQFRRADDDVAQWLSIGGAGGKSRGPDEATKVVVGDWLLGKAPDGPSALKNVIEIHEW
jgi:hypothetical protein